MPCAPSSMLTAPGKLLLKTQLSEDVVKRSDSNNIIQCGGPNSVGLHGSSHSRGEGGRDPVLSLLNIFQDIKVLSRSHLGGILGCVL